MSFFGRVGRRGLQPPCPIYGLGCVNRCFVFFKVLASGAFVGQVRARRMSDVVDISRRLSDRPYQTGIGVSVHAQTSIRVSHCSSFVEVLISLYVP